MSNRVLVLLIFSLLTMTAHSQEKIKYKGKLSNGFSKAGDVSYVYIKDPETGKKIKTGNFRYSLKEKDKDHRFYQNITGRYLNNNKDGEWNYRINQKDFELQQPGIFTTGSIDLTANYLDGKPHGKWVYNSSLKHRTGILKGEKYSWDPYSKEEVIQIVVHFNQGSLTDSFFIQISDGYSITGYIDSNGFMDRKWSWEIDDTLTQYMYNYGVLTTMMVHDNEGNTIHKKNFDQRKLLYDEYIKVKEENPAGLVKYSFSVKEVNILKNVDHLITKTLSSTIYNDEYFMYRYISGDLTYYYDKNQYRFVNKSRGIKLIDFTNRISQGQINKYLKIDKLLKLMEDHFVLLAPYVKMDKLNVDSKKMLELMERNREIAERYSCIGETVKLHHNYQAGIDKSKISCQYNADLENPLPDFSTRDELLKYIVKEISTLKEQNLVYYNAILQSLTN